MQLTINLLSLFLGCVFTGQFIVTVISMIYYPGSNKQLKDNLNGVNRVFRPLRPFTLAGICWCILLGSIG